VEARRPTMPKTVHKPGRDLILRVIRPDGEESPPDPFAASLFGLIYEKLLEYYFKQQKFTASNYPVWRFVGKPLVEPDGAKRRIPLDYLVEDTTRRGSSPSRPGFSEGSSHLVCFEAKSWPGFQKFHTISSKNVERFLDYNERFLGYIECKKWYAKLDSGETKEITPNAFGFLVFDYDPRERQAILTTFSKRNRKLREIESIVDLLSMVIYNKNRLGSEFAHDLMEKQRTASSLFSLFL
jgi:hypothetical protein